jgi:hypothetical protein
MSGDAKDHPQVRVWEHKDVVEAVLRTYNQGGGEDQGPGGFWNGIRR